MEGSIGVIDRKFLFAGTNPITGRIVSEFDGIVMLATDIALPATIQFYRAECEQQGAAPEVIESLNGLYERVVKFQAAHPENCKVADLSPEECVAQGLQPPTQETATEVPPPATEPVVDEPAPVGDPSEGNLTPPKSEPTGI